MKAVIFALALVAVQATSDEELWAQFKVEHGKTYRDLHEEKQRFTIFQSTLRTIEEHNAKYENGEKSYFLKVTQFADMAPQEFQEFLALGSNSIPELEYNISEVEEAEKAEEGLEKPPASIDWRAKGAVLEVKDQGTNCGACWAFFTTSYLESQLAIKRKKKISLSEQNLIDCSNHGNSGCKGGNVYRAFEYIHDNGINTEAYYPYLARNGASCRFDKKKSVATIGKIHLVKKTEDELKKAVAKVGPIAASFDGSHLHSYGGGIYNPASCEQDFANHGGLVVGYGGAGNQEYWIVKNTWGPRWGEQGYFRLIRNHDNKCGIASHPKYADLK